MNLTTLTLWAQIAFTGAIFIVAVALVLRGGMAADFGWVLFVTSYFSLRSTRLYMIEEGMSEWRKE